MVFNLITAFWDTLTSAWCIAFAAYESSNTNASKILNINITKSELKIFPLLYSFICFYKRALHPAENHFNVCLC